MAEARPENRSADFDPKNMSLVEHLRELRKRLVYALGGIGVGFFIAYANAQVLFGWLMKPLLDAMPEGAEKRMVFTGLAQPFLVDLKVGIFGGLILALPFLLYQIWSFVAPALYPQERRGVVPFIVSALFFFATGVAFAYFIAFPFAFQYFLGYSSAELEPMLSIHEYLDFATQMFLGFGAMFEMPLVIFLLAKFGIMTPQQLAKNRQWAVLAIAVISAIFTPADALSMLVMAVPLYVLFEGSVLVARIVYRNQPVLVDAEGNLVDEDDSPEGA